MLAKTGDVMVVRNGADRDHQVVGFQRAPFAAVNSGFQDDGPAVEIDIVHEALLEADAGG